ncbi:MAG: cytochrome b561 domain-containing protein [Hydrogenophaga sp.]|nr:cytochrome b561 domain-containing protein [Hydrogenophaga sp.]
MPFLSLAWWLSPMSGASEHHLPDWAIWHARTMVAAWAVLLPLGVLAARYFKVTPGQDWPGVKDNRFWWHAHRSLQYLGAGLIAIGVWLAWDRGGLATPVATWHHWLGWLVVVLGAGQLVSGWSRGSKGGPTDTNLRGDHYDMTRRRRWFERLHKGLGWLAIGIAVLTVVLGLITADAPRWMAGLLTAWWLLLACLAWRWQQQGRCIDTYQAIWGPDPSHPGNQQPVTGWGVRRMAAPASSRHPVH